jgi:hypothetical protein
MVFLVFHYVPVVFSYSCCVPVMFPLRSHNIAVVFPLYSLSEMHLGIQELAKEMLNVLNQQLQHMQMSISVCIWSLNGDGLIDGGSRDPQCPESTYICVSIIPIIHCVPIMFLGTYYSCCVIPIKIPANIMPNLFVGFPSNLMKFPKQTLI